MSLHADLALSVFSALDLAILVCDERLAAVQFANPRGHELLATLGSAAPRLPAELRDTASEARRCSSAVPLRRLLVRARSLPGTGCSLVTAAAEGQRTDELARRYGLTHRECEVVALVRAGRSNAEIGDALDLTVGTVKQYMNHILAAVGARTRTQLMALLDGRT
jgi:DNA-binding CsgD family transcriptional regulator